MTCQTVGWNIVQRRQGPEVTHTGTARTSVQNCWKMPAVAWQPQRCPGYGPAGLPCISTGHISLDAKTIPSLVLILPWSSVAQGLWDHLVGSILGNIEDDVLETHAPVW